MALRVLVTGVRRSLAEGLRPTASRSLQTRLFSREEDFVKLHPSGMPPKVTNTPAIEIDDLDDLDDDDTEDMVAVGPSGVEYGGPTRGGKLKEPTRYGDWERKGRCSDF